MHVAVTQHITPDIEPKPCTRRLRSKAMEEKGHPPTSRKQKAESRKQKAESRKQKAESRKQKAESRKQKAESRKQKAESRKALIYRSACKVNNIDDYTVELMAEFNHSNNSTLFIFLTRITYFYQYKPTIATLYR
ncbi:hypothetical protein [Zymobacter sp. IVIA_12111.31 C1]|uniref:hypothetical protein n=1 Tax=Zymobacter sp. IVIA_12111.31 C1 TaxID=3394854 RepID=UPI0039C2AFA3